MGKLALSRLVLGMLMVVPAVLAFVPAGNSTHSATVPCVDEDIFGNVACPDLIVEPAKMNVHYEQTMTFTASSCEVGHGTTVPGTRALLRFYFSTPNFGNADLVIGAPSQHPEWFVFDSCHGHHHMREYADYRLWDPATFVDYKMYRLENPDLTAAQVFQNRPDLVDGFLAANKRGFCVIDLFPYIPLPSNYGACDTNQGISVGWADEYVPGLTGQWVDVTDVAPGPYILEAEVNAERMYVESDYTNNSSAAPVVVASL